MENKQYPEVKIIENIEPFNEIWYKNCIYQAYLPVIKCFTDSILAVLMSSFFVYDLDDSNLLFLKEINFKLPVEFQAELGIGMKAKYKSDDIIKDLETAIQNDRVALIFIDSFYESIKPEYNKVHGTHCFPIYGYNRDQQIFHIIECKYTHSQLYEKRILPYQDIINGYNGFIENIQPKAKKPSYFEYYDAKGKKNFTTVQQLNEYYLSEFIENVMEKYQDFIKGEEVLECFYDEFQKIVLDEISFIESYEKLITDSDNMVNNKQIEIYRVMKAFDKKPELLNLLEEMLNHWIFIRSVLSRYRFTKEYKPNRLIHCCERLKTACDLEKHFNQVWFELLEQYRREMQHG